MLFPAVFIYCALLLSPILQAVFQSFYTWNGIKSVPFQFAGISNFIKIFSSGRFWGSVINSGWFMLIGFVVLMPLSFILANISVSIMRGAHFFKTAYFIPVVLPVTAVGLMWRYLLNPDGGLVNSLLLILGVTNPPRWLGDPKIAIQTVALVNEWIYAGFNMLIFAAGLVGIPADLFEAAKIDGASERQKLFWITLPLMKESFKIFSVLCVTGCLRTFDLVFVMTRGGPAHATEMPATLLYNEAFKYQNFGVGNAIAVFMLVVGISVSIILNKHLAAED